MKYFKLVFKRHLSLAISVLNTLLNIYLSLPQHKIMQIINKPSAKRHLISVYQFYRQINYVEFKWLVFNA